MFNEDSTHFVYSRSKKGIHVGIKELREFIDQYADTQVKEFVINVNAMMAWFPSKSRENAIDKYLKWAEKHIDQEDYANIAQPLVDIYVNQGLDMREIWIDRLRENKISPWMSIRMNDIHNTDDEEHFLISQFWRDNKHMSRASHHPKAGYFDNAFDYSFPEVREYNIALIREVVERYDIDGLELDWMREPFTLGIGKEFEGIEIITSFMQEVRNILDTIEKARGHKIKIGVRVPQSPEMALRFGLDAINWARSGLVDVIVPTARWTTTDNDMPIDLWKRILSNTSVMLCAGIELLIEATRSPLKQWMFNSVETVRGSAAAYLSMGADRIYLFNYFDKSDGIYNGKEYPSCEDSAVDTNNYSLLLTTIGDFNTATKLARRHVTTYHDITAPGTRVCDLLPFTCNPPDSIGNYDFHDVRIVTGPVDLNAEVTIIIGIHSKDELNNSDCLVFINGHLCIFIGYTIPPKPRPACKLYSFKIIGDYRYPDVSIVEIASKRTPFCVEWVEIAIH